MPIGRERFRTQFRAGTVPQEADAELGYIVPGEESGPAVRQVSAFVEKPSLATARALIERGGLWNSFIFAASGASLLRAFERRCPDIVAEMRQIVAADGDGPRVHERLADLYARLPVLDFSRDVMERCTAQLRVLPVPACDWSDLGTPRRVAEAVGRGWPAAEQESIEALHVRGFLDLAAQHARLEAT